MLTNGDDIMGRDDDEAVCAQALGALGDIATWFNDPLLFKAKLLVIRQTARQHGLSGTAALRLFVEYWRLLQTPHDDDLIARKLDDFARTQAKPRQEG